MKRKIGSILIVLLGITDLILLVGMLFTLPTGAIMGIVYSVDFLVVGLMILNFYRRMKESKKARAYLYKNWYEIPGMIPIIVFVLAAQGSDISDGIITAGVMLRGLALINVLKLSSYLESKSKILGGYVLLQLFIIFFLTLIVLTLLFYSAEHRANSKITTMGDALWWTIQTTSTATFGPNPATEVGRMVGAIIMFIGIGITTTFISTLAAGLTKTRIRGTSNDESDPEQILKVRLAKGEITKEVFLDLKKLISSKATTS
jgi:voltage-gated potassium channel